MSCCSSSSIAFVGVATRAGVGGGVGVGVTGSICIDATGSGVGSLGTLVVVVVVGVFGRLLVLLVALRVGLIDFNFFGDGRGETSRLVRVVFLVTFGELCGS